MAELPTPEPEIDPPKLEAGPFRWQVFFQRAQEPLFLLNRQRRLLFVNRAWEDLTGQLAVQVRGRLCKRRAHAEPGSWEALARALAPPPEVLSGKPARVRRLVARTDPGNRWWDIDFFPLRDAAGLLGVLGKITVMTLDHEAATAPLPEELVSLRASLAQRYGFDQLASSLPTVRRVVEQARLASQTRIPVLLVGEMGTGKQWLARAIHYQSTSRERAFAAVDCVRLPLPAVASLLFGDAGLVRRPAIGTLYLHGPERLPRDLQVQLCDWLANAEADIQDPRLVTRAETAGPRLITGCMADPKAEVRAGRLLEELYCTLGTLVIALPALSERRADLPELVDRMLRRLNRLDERSITNLSPEAWEFIRGYPWPGNLRELYAVLTGARLRAKGDHIDAADLPAFLRQAVNLGHIQGGTTARPLPLDHLLEQSERRLIQLALRMSGGKHTRAAKLLDIPRPRLWRRMKHLGLAQGKDEG